MSYFQMLESMAVSHFLKSMFNDVADVYPIITVTNKSAIDIRIRKGHRSQNILKSDRDLR